MALRRGSEQCQGSERCRSDAALPPLGPAARFAQAARSSSPRAAAPSRSGRPSPAATAGRPSATRKWCGTTSACSATARPCPPPARTWATTSRTARVRAVPPRTAAPLDAARARSPGSQFISRLAPAAVLPREPLLHQPRERGCLPRDRGKLRGARVVGGWRGAEWYRRRQRGRRGDDEPRRCSRENNTRPSPGQSMNRGSGNMIMFSMFGADHCH